MGEQCSEHVHEQGMGVSFYPCERNATIDRDGKWYCWQHDPKAVRARQEASTRRYNEELMATKRHEQAHYDAIWNEAIETAAHLVCEMVCDQEHHDEYIEALLRDAGDNQLIEAETGIRTLKREPKP